MHRDCSQIRRAFTLFEITISLAILAVGVVTVMALIPVGLKAQQQARFAAYASAKALDLLETFNCQVFNNGATLWAEREMSLAVEKNNPWDTSIASRAYVCDLETKLSTVKGGLLPLPMTIARRLDSADDEIANLLGAGGRLYYPNPMATNDEEGSYNWAWESQNSLRSMYGTSETRRLLVGIVGHAQANKVPNNPFKTGPYYHGYPSPPVNFEKIEDADAKLLYDQGYWAYHLWDVPPVADVPLPQTPDQVPAASRPDQAGCERYVRLAFWYARKHGLPTAFLDGNAQDSDVDAHFANADHVRTLRYLAHAVTCLTKWYTADKLTATVTLLDQDILTNSGAVVVPASDPDNREISITLDGIRNWHQRCLDMAMRHAASFPYNWGALRPINRAIMMDVPLLEWDLFPDSGTPLLSGSIYKLGPGYGPVNVPAQHYRMLAPMAISSRGSATVNDQLSTSDQGSRIDFPASPFGQTAAFNAVFGDIDHFTLTRPFAPDERCRELVFWMADWQGYEDFETAPSAPVDASKFPIRRPRIWPEMVFDDQMKGFGFMPLIQTSSYNPERQLLHGQDVAMLPNGANTKDLQINHQWLTDSGNVTTTPAALSMFSGLYGGDRNQNGYLDRGPLSAAVRMRAIPIARFVVYDPRIPLNLR